jgi:hypothetical protein
MLLIENGRVVDIGIPTDVMKTYSQQMRIDE